MRKISDREKIDKTTEELGPKTNRSRFNLLNFCSFGKGDIILVLLYYGKFSLYKAIGYPKPVCEIEDLSEIINNNDFFFDTEKKAIITKATNEIVDLGFAIPVMPLKENLSRYEYADKALTARMKMRQTKEERL